MQTAIGFRASEMATPLSQAFSVPTDMKSGEARATLLALRFDQAPVMAAERLVGWVRVSHLGGRGYVESSLTPLDQSIVLSRDALVGDAIQMVARSGLVFLAGRSGITDFVVGSDLDRHAVRCHLYVVLSDIELHLADIAREVLSEDDVKGRFKEDQAQRYRAARAKGQETHAVEYLYLSDYVSLVDTLPDLQARCNADARALRKRLHDLNELRNCVAHPSKSLTGRFEPAEIARLTMLAEAFVDELTD